MDAIGQAALAFCAPRISKRGMESAAPPCIILNVPQLAQNIGAVARVMANFGLADLRHHESAALVEKLKTDRPRQRRAFRCIAIGNRDSLRSHLRHIARHKTMDNR